MTSKVNHDYIRDHVIKQYESARIEQNNDVDSAVDVNKLSTDFMMARLEFANWYDSKPEEIQFLIDEISDRTYSIVDEAEYDGFIEVLASYGITSAQQFEDAFDSEREGTGESVQAEFAEEFYDAMGMMPTDEAILYAIDWERVYSHSLQYDFMEIEFKGNTYFLRNNF